MWYRYFTRYSQIVLRAGVIAVAVSLGSANVAVGDTQAAVNDYPTEARVDYVIGCMASNGQDYLTMQRCSCSIDTIAELMPYKEYEEVETIMRMRDGRGELGVLFRTSPALQEKLQRFQHAQVEADLRCF